MSENIRQLVRESNALEQCQDCGAFLVDPSTHRCPDPDRSAPTTRAERERLAEDDPRDDGTEVGIFRRSTGDSYAYHDVDGDAEPICNSSARTKATTIEVVPLAEARSRGKSPCGSCRRIREERG